MHLLSGFFYSGPSKHHAKHRDHDRRTGIYFPAVGPHGERTGRDGSQVRKEKTVMKAGETVLNVEHTSCFVCTHTF